MKKKILITTDIYNEIIIHLSKFFVVEENREAKVLKEDELIQKLQGKSGVFSSPSNIFNEKVFKSCPKLKIVSNMAVGYNNIDIKAANESGVLITNTPDVLNEATADFGWALILAAARRLTESEIFLRANEWNEIRYDLFLGNDVNNTTLGIIGMGRVGQAIARRSIGFDMKVLYHNRSQLSSEIEANSNNAKFVSFKELLSQSDHILLMLPYSKEVHHLIGLEEIKLMKPSTSLINLARGGIINETDLIFALKNKIIASAALDVFENEPNFNQELLKLSNIVLSPHIGSASKKTRLAMAYCASKNLIDTLIKLKPTNVINKNSINK